MSLKRPREDEIRIATEAARWHELLRGASTNAEVGARIRAEFADWVKASPRHLREFMFMEAIDAAAREVDPEHQLELASDLSALEEAVSAWPAQEMSAVPGKPFWGEKSQWFAAAAAVALVSFLGLLWWTKPELVGGWQRYATAVGEQRTLGLQDGSVIQLNTHSRLRVRMNANSRDIELVEGEALFKVTQDPNRPFRVRAGETVIRALGTEFNVYRRPRATEVAVLEGRVEISRAAHEAAATRESASSVDSRLLPKSTEGSVAVTLMKPTQLGAGQAVRIEEKGAVVQEKRTDVAEITAWRQRRLVFREESLGVIAEEFNRYNQAPKIIVTDAAARARRYGGTFDADDPESLMLFVTRGGELVARRDGERIVISGR